MQLPLHRIHVVVLPESARRRFLFTTTRGKKW
jgi:hypothetical protein